MDLLFAKYDINHNKVTWPKPWSDNQLIYAGLLDSRYAVEVQYNSNPKLCHYIVKDLVNSAGLYLDIIPLSSSNVRQFGPKDEEVAKWQKRAINIIDAKGL